jgi:hypothetical protein
MEVWPNTSLCRSRSCTQLVWVSGSNPEIRVLRISYWEISECRHSYETGAIPLPNFDSASYRAKEHCSGVDQGFIQFFENPLQVLLGEQLRAEMTLQYHSTKDGSHHSQPALRRSA